MRRVGGSRHSAARLGAVSGRERGEGRSAGGRGGTGQRSSSQGERDPLKRSQQVTLSSMEQRRLLRVSKRRKSSGTRSTHRATRGLALVHPLAEPAGLTACVAPVTFGSCTAERSRPARPLVARHLSRSLRLTGAVAPSRISRHKDASLTPARYTQLQRRPRPDRFETQARTGSCPPPHFVRRPFFDVGWRYSARRDHERR